MKLGRYLAGNAHMAVIAVLLAALMGFIVRTIGAPGSLAAFVSALVVLAATLALGIDFARRRRFYNELGALLDALDNPRLAVTLLDEPAFADGQAVCEALARVSKFANDDVAEARRQVEDYREYVETWVHEAKSPLAAAHLMLENMDAAAPAAPGDAPTTCADAGSSLAERLDTLDEELRRVERYIEQALFYARSETVDRDYLIRPCSLRELVGAAVKANAHALIGARVAVRLESLDDKTVFTDKKWLLFVLGQLIQNSVKYARADGAELVFEAQRVGEGLADEHILLDVRDNGCGVPEADLPRVFDKGFTGENGRSGKRSTGIGLYLVKRLCDKMALSVTASSREGEGFSVSIGFPMNKMRLMEQGGGTSL